MICYKIPDPVKTTGIKHENNEKNNFLIRKSCLYLQPEIVNS
jgi:hypothetical protein